MPFFQNLKKQICQVYEPEVKKVVEAGWKELSDVEEQLYREGLAAEQDLTSAVAIEEARVKAGIYKVINDVKGQTETAVSTAEKSATSKGSSDVSSNK